VLVCLPGSRLISVRTRIRRRLVRLWSKRRIGARFAHEQGEMQINANSPALDVSLVSSSSHPLI
jgi:hypothetical protein